MTGGVDQRELASLLRNALEPLVVKEGKVIAAQLREDLATELRDAKRHPAMAVDHEARKAAALAQLSNDQHAAECARRYGEISDALDRLSSSVSRIHGRINGYIVAVLGAAFTIILALAGILMKGV